MEAADIASVAFAVAATVAAASVTVVPVVAAVPVPRISGRPSELPVRSSGGRNC